MEKTIFVFNNIMFHPKKITFIISGIAVLVMMIMISADALGRSLFSFAIPGTYEITEKYVMTLVVLPALAFAYGLGVFPKIEMFYDRFPKNIQSYVMGILLLLEFLLFSLVTYYGWKIALEVTRDQLSFPAAGKLMPLYPFFYLVPFSFGLLSLEVVRKFLNRFVYKGPGTFRDFESEE